MTARLNKSVAAKRTTHISLPSELIEEARRLYIDISKACEQGLELQVAKSRAERWQEENREAIEYWNAYVDEHGLPLAKYRQF